MTDRKTTLFSVAAAAELIAFGTAGSAHGAGDYIDVHMHLHPTGLGGGQSGSGAGNRMGFGGPGLGLVTGGFSRPSPGTRRPFMSIDPNRDRRRMGPRPINRPGLGMMRQQAIRGAGGSSREQNLAKAAENLVAKMDELGIAKALVMVVPSHRFSGEEDYQGIRNAQRRHPGRLYLMAGGATLGPMIRETDPDLVTDVIRKKFRARAEKVLAEGAKGFGEMISYHLCMSSTHSFQEAPADHPLFLLLADIAAKNNVPIDLHMEAVETGGNMPENLLRACGKNPATLNATIPRLERLLRHNRGARVVLQHIGWDNVSQMTPRLLRRILNIHPNLYLALRVEERTRQKKGQVLNVVFCRERSDDRWRRDIRCARAVPWGKYRGRWTEIQYSRLDPIADDPIAEALDKAESSHSIDNRVPLRRIPHCPDALAKLKLTLCILTSSPLGLSPILGWKAGGCTRWTFTEGSGLHAIMIIAKERREKAKANEQQ